jgi:replicative DNA helicase
MFPLRKLLSTVKSQRSVLRSLVEGNYDNELSERMMESSIEEDGMMKDLVLEAIERIEHLYETRGSIAGLPTGFQELDRLTSGLQAPDLIVFGSRPSMGKTALSMNIVEHIAIDLGKAVGMFSLEMSSRQLTQRLLCSRAKVNLQRVRNGFLSERDFPMLVTAASNLAISKIMIDDTAELMIGALRERARKLRDQHSVELIVVDYLNLVRPDRPRQNRHEEMLDICGQLKGMAKELGVPVIVTAQLNRQADARGLNGQPPRLIDLRDCGSIEEDADIVGLLFRLEYYQTGQEIEQAITGEAELIIAKQRNGPTGEVPLTFLKEYARFQSRIQEVNRESDTPKLKEKLAGKIRNRASQ